MRGLPSLTPWMPGLFIGTRTVADYAGLCLLFTPTQARMRMVAVVVADRIIHAVMTSSRP